MKKNSDPQHQFQSIRLHIHPSIYPNTLSGFLFLQFLLSFQFLYCLGTRSLVHALTFSHCPIHHNLLTFLTPFHTHTSHPFHIFTHAQPLSFFSVSLFSLAFTCTIYSLPCPLIIPHSPSAHLKSSFSFINLAL